MIENRVLSMDDYAAMLRRRLKIIIVPTLLAPLVGFLISYAFPAKYTSQALVLVEDQKVPQGYVAPVVTEDLSQRIATLEQKALGTDRLQPLIQKLNQQGLLHGGNIDDVIDQIRGGVAIEPVQMVMVPNPAAKPASPRPGLAAVRSSASLFADATRSSLLRLDHNRDVAEEIELRGKRLFSFPATKYVHVAPRD